MTDPTKVVDSSFANIDVETEKATTAPNIDLDILQALSRMYGWSDALQKWLRIKSDAQGRLLTSGNTATSFTINAVSATSPGPANPVILLNQNPSRKFFIVYNSNYTRAVIGFNALMNTAQGFTIGHYGFYGDDFYTGPVYLLARDAISASVEALEFT
jgi:hypothetical protein